MRRAIGAALLLLTGLLPARAAAPAPPSGGSGKLCVPRTHEGAAYTVCTIDLRRYDLKLFLDGPDGKPFGSLSALARSPEGGEVAMAMNAGMYHEDLSPVGLFVQGGRQVKAANTKNGPGNFHLKPNGVFYVAGGKAGVLETSAFLKRRPRASLATQSGPMLVIDGRLHPRFSDEGPSKKVRNGVGVRDPKTAIFAISDEPVSFGAFARLFRDELGCRNALFLDGSVSTLYAPASGRNDLTLKPIGPIIGAIPRPADKGKSARGRS